MQMGFFPPDILMQIKTSGNKNSKDYTDFTDPGSNSIWFVIFQILWVFDWVCLMECQMGEVCTWVYCIGSILPGMLNQANSIIWTQMWYQIHKEKQWRPLCPALCVRVGIGASSDSPSGFQVGGLLFQWTPSSDSPSGFKGGGPLIKWTSTCRKVKTRREDNNGLFMSVKMPGQFSTQIVQIMNSCEIHLKECLGSVWNYAASVWALAVSQLRISLASP